MKYNIDMAHQSLKNKYNDGDIVTLEELIDIIGTPKNIEEYKKYGRLKNSKHNTLNKLQKHCIVEYINGKEYRIIKIRENPISNKTLRILKSKENDEILYNLIIVLSQYSKEIFADDKERNLNIMLLDLAFSVNLINDNYKTIKFNKNKVAEYYDTKEEYVYDFIETSNYVLKHYIEAAIELLADYNIITVTQNRKLVKNYKKFIDNNTVQEYEEIVWASDEENKLINNIIDEIFKEYEQIYIKNNYNKFTLRDFYFGKYAEEINVKLHKELKNYNIVKFYNGYGLTILISGYIDELLKELPDGNKSVNVLSKKMNSLVIEKVCQLMQSRSNKNVLTDIGSFADVYTGLTLLETAKKLGKVSLNYNSQYKLSDKMKLSYEKKKATKVKTIENVRVINKTNKQIKKTKRKSK